MTIQPIRPIYALGQYRRNKPVIAATKAKAIAQTEERAPARLLSLFEKGMLVDLLA